MQALDQPYLQTGLLEMMRKRAGWLSVLFIGEMLTASAMGFFENEIASAVVLALFVPLIISSGGNAGSQAATSSSAPWRWAKCASPTPCASSAASSPPASCSARILCVLGILQDQHLAKRLGNLRRPWLQIAATVGLSLIGVVAWGTLAGAILPIAIDRIGFDPASASAPFVATLVDVCGLVIYFTVARIFLTGILL